MGGVIKLPAYFKDHYYRSADDRLDLYARIYGNADGVPILMMHGLTRNSADFEKIAKFLYPEFSLIYPRTALDGDGRNMILIRRMTGRRYMRRTCWLCWNR